MKQKTHRHRNVRRLGVALTLAGVLYLTSASPAPAQDLGEYFQINYDSVSFDKDRVNGNELFYAIITGRAICTKDLPALVSEALVTSHIVAEHTVSGTKVTLNSNYTITIKPFPCKKDETFEINQAVPMQFPPEAELGEYNIIGQLVEAKVKVILWVPITDFLPQEQQMGTIKYIATEPALTTPVETAVIETVVPAPVAEAPAPPETPALPALPTLTSRTTASPEPAESTSTWWVWLIFVFAIAITAFNVYWYIRQRRG